MSLKIVRSQINDVVEEYLRLYGVVFGDEDLFQAPSTVYLGYEGDECIGFTAGYLRNLNTFYMQYMGIIPEKRHGRNGVKYFKAILDELDKEYPYLEGAIWNGNIVALKMALKYGFKVIGTRVNTYGKLLVEILRENPNIKNMPIKMNRRVSDADYT